MRELFIAYGLTAVAMLIGLLLMAPTGARIFAGLSIRSW
jgi:hypothetical protein